MKLGILKTDTVRPDQAARFGEYPDMFMRLLGGAEPKLAFEVYDVERASYPRDIDEVDAYLITGSKAGVYDDAPWIATLMDFVRALHGRRKPLIGICFGHQLVAQALGGRAEKSSRGWGVGVHTHHFSTLPDWHDGGSADFDVLVSHQDQVVEVAPGARVLAGSEFCAYAVTQLADHILTFQGHPEFVPGYARELMVARRELLGEALYQRGIASLNREHQGARAARWMLDFLRRAS